MLVELTKNSTFFYLGWINAIVVSILFGEWNGTLVSMCNPSEETHRRSVDLPKKYYSSWIYQVTVVVFIQGWGGTCTPMPCILRGKLLKQKWAKKWDEIYNFGLLWPAGNHQNNGQILSAWHLGSFLVIFSNPISVWFDSFDSQWNICLPIGREHAGPQGFLLGV